jgi:hypothetical protein
MKLVRLVMLSGEGALECGQPDLESREGDELGLGYVRDQVDGDGGLSVWEHEAGHASSEVVYGGEEADGRAHGRVCFSGKKTKGGMFPGLLVSRKLEYRELLKRQKQALRVMSCRHVSVVSAVSSLIRTSTALIISPWEIGINAFHGS